MNFEMLVSFIFCFVAMSFDPACWSQSVRSILSLDIAKHNPAALAVAVTNKKGAVGTSGRSGNVKILLDSCRLPYSRRKCLVVEAAESSPQLRSPFPNEASLLKPTSHEYELTKSPLTSELGIQHIWYLSNACTRIRRPTAISHQLVPC